MTLAIRRMLHEDVEAVYNIEVKSFHTPWSINSLDEEVDNPIALYLVAEVAGKIVGYMGGWIILDECHIANIAVDPDYRGLHIGKAILNRMITVAEQAGVTSFTLEVRTSNTVARNMYDSFGFKEEGIRKGYYEDTGEDALIMWRRS